MSELFYLIVFVCLFFLQKKEPVGNDESIPENLLNLDDLTSDTLAVSYCPFLGWGFSSYRNFLPRQVNAKTLLHTALSLNFCSWDRSPLLLLYTLSFTGQQNGRQMEWKGQGRKKRKKELWLTYIVLFLNLL